MRPLVTILTYCAHPALAYGTLLVFKSLRTGFPTADIEVYDNGSHPEVRDQIIAECARVGASFTGIKPQSWADHYKWLLLDRQPDGRPLVILDPDVILWESIEDWDFTGSLMAGRRMKRINAGHLVQHARLHPSLLWIQDVPALRLAMGTQGASLIEPTLKSFDGEPHFWDTFSLLYEELVHWCHGFGPERLDCFDHLFYGSHIPAIAAQISTGDLGVIADAHVVAANGELEKLRGIWRQQEEFFEGSDHPSAARTEIESGPDMRLHRMLGAASMLAAFQQKQYPDQELMVAMEQLARRVGRQQEGTQ